MLLLTAIAFVVMLLALVLVHEFGHLIVAKWAGCRVEEFGFGFPPRLFSKIWRGTKYSFNLLPLGGFVRIEGENMDEQHPTPTSFASKSASWRVAILAAGVVMNVLLAYVLLTFQAGIGAPVAATDATSGTLTDYKTYILEVADGSPAAQAGIKAYDRVVRMNGVENPTIETVQQITTENLGTSIPVVVNREGQDMTVEILAREQPPEGQGAMGVSLISTGLEKVSWLRAPVVGAQRTVAMMGAIVFQFGNLIQRVIADGVVDEAFTGPVGIALYTNEATRMGLPYLLEFVALISINLAIINILPIPALDGGRILFIGFEKLFGRKRLTTFESYAHTTGFALLILLMVLITFKDIQKYF